MNHVIGGTSYMAHTIAALILIAVTSCGNGIQPGAVTEPCSTEWIQLVEDKLSTSDSQGHGPDLGSMEWRSTVEFKLGIRDDPAVPDLESVEWCLYVNEKVFEAEK